jgi:hypothetical protein
MKESVQEGGTRLRAWMRGLLAGPIALAASCLIMAGGALWIPAGAAQVNNLVLPIVLFPLLWTALFLYACLDKKLARAYTIIGALTVANAVLLSLHLSQ